MFCVDSKLFLVKGPVIILTQIAKIMSIKPYTAVGLIPTVRGIRKREDIRHNLTHIKHLTIGPYSRSYQTISITIPRILLVRIHPTQ